MEHPRLGNIFGQVSNQFFAVRWYKIAFEKLKNFDSKNLSYSAWMVLFGSLV
jgi:hypothetical protein